MNKPFNRGVNLELEAIHRSEQDWVFGAASLPAIVTIPLEEREAWLPKGEVQVGKDDMSDCATRGPTNILEMLFTYHYNHGMKAANKKWLEDQGYANGGKVTFSDRFTAILSGTTHAGNSLIAPLDSIHNNGLIPKKLLPLGPTMTWDQYYDKAGITVAMLDLGKEFNKRFTINYERVFAKDFPTLSKKELVSIAVYAWPTPDSQLIYHSNIASFNHCVAMWKPEYFVFDNYLEFDPKDGMLDIPDDFVKQLASDYLFFEYGYRIFISAEITPEEAKIEQTVFDVLKKNGLLAYFAAWWDKFSKTVQGLIGPK